MSTGRPGHVVIMEIMLYGHIPSSRTRLAQIISETRRDSSAHRFGVPLNWNGMNLPRSSSWACVLWSAYANTSHNNRRIDDRTGVFWKLLRFMTSDWLGFNRQWACDKCINATISIPFTAKIQLKCDNFHVKRASHGAHNQPIAYDGRSVAHRHCVASHFSFSFFNFHSLPFN